MKIDTLINVLHSQFAKLTYPYLRARSKKCIDLKVKLVAIAKNESAYIPEWVYHHLYFGFDQIAIYYNGCSDNTLELLPFLPEDRVRFINADSIFENTKGNPQLDIYRREFKYSRQQGYGHLMFLDLDEFWVPANLDNTIQEYISALPYFDSLCFQWVNRIDEEIPFDSAIKERLKVEDARQVKAIHKTFITPGLMTPHNLIDNLLCRIMEDGRAFKPGNGAQSVVANLTVPEKAFVLHRKYRSKKEYISLLGRGRPLAREKVVSSFKDNRNGYCDPEKGRQLTFDAVNYCKYNTFMSSKLADFVSSSSYKLAKEHVLQRYCSVICDIKNASKDELPILLKVLRNVDLKEVQQAFEEYKKKIA